MKKYKVISMKQNNQEQVPVFEIKDVAEQRSEGLMPRTEQVSFFEIKELYDRAYEAKDLSDNNGGRDDYKAREMMAEAIKMDMAYRCQLARRSKYKKPSQMDDFKIITKKA